MKFLFTGRGKMGGFLRNAAQARGDEVDLLPMEAWEAEVGRAASALKGCVGVVVAPGPSPQGATRLVEVVTKAQSRAGVKRVVLLSTVGTGDGKRHAGPILNSKLVEPFRRARLAAFESAERVVRASPLEWTIVRALTLTDGRFRSRYRVARERSPWRILPTVGRIQVAHFVVHALVEHRHVGEALTLTR